MKKSEAFKMAQLAVLGNDAMPIKTRAEILEILMWEESFAKMVEEMQAQKESKEEAENETV
jgi:hypothetical protein